MIKTVIKVATFWLSMCALVYGLGVFIWWEPNAANWHQTGRIVVAWFWFMSLLLSVGLVTSRKNND